MTVDLQDDDRRLLLTVDAAARRPSLKRTATYRLIQTGALRSLKLGGARRVLLSDLEAFVLELRNQQELEGAI